MSTFQSDNVTVERDTDGSYVLTIDVPNKSVNLLSRAVLADLDHALDFLAREPRVPVVVLRSGKKSGFVAGADIAEFRLIRTSAEAQTLSELGQKLFAKLAGLA